eukprot:CAMPEP_0175369246 /NCGR_PEP_ID=MMETSP0095-20121207/20593_1 /TAXON_ID=311494 /ORGANISM="Alexandrium monilatum, Strain CCMP3105" /LENGTH=159 /DNA_ID=CAMNT_0016667357 /DNA_START=213 /DNA_END=688 /DNA_ORIENTATION=+
MMVAKQSPRSYIHETIVQHMVVWDLRIALPGLEVEVPDPAEVVLEEQRGAHVSGVLRTGHEIPHLLLRVLWRPLDLEENLSIDVKALVPESPAHACLNEEHLLVLDWLRAAAQIVGAGADLPPHRRERVLCNSGVPRREPEVGDPHAAVLEEQTGGAAR